MAVVTMRELLEAGVHFGHLTRRWNPKMKNFIFGKKQDIYILDLHKTLIQLEQAYSFVRDKVAQGGTVLFVGTKRQAQEAVEESAKSCGMFYVTTRWLPGTLTNFTTIRSRVDYMNELRSMERSGIMDALPKKESVNLRKKLAKLENVLVGIENMDKRPDILYVVDIRREEIALREARRLKIPTIAIVDTNCDPEEVDFPIPGNDDAIRSIWLITDKIAEAVREGLALKEALIKEEVSNEPSAEGIPPQVIPAVITTPSEKVEEEEKVDETIQDMSALYDQYMEPPEEKL